jgi:hypothetical protein
LSEETLVKQIIGYGVITLIVVLGLIQLIPLDRHNPPVESDISTSPEVKAVLRRACYDCHSNETVWPWYSRIAPVSWLLARDVQEGREALNFSLWNQYNTKKQMKKLKESWKEVERGSMPPWVYTVLHPNAYLSAQDQALLRQWTGTALGTSTGDDTAEPAARH